MPEPLATPAALQERLADVGGVLRRTETMWRDLPFHLLELPWERDLPDLARWLRARSDDEAEALEAGTAVDLHPDLVWLIRETDTAAAVTSLTTTGTVPDAVRHGREIPGRKWAQIAAVAARAPHAPRLVDWCAGKGHLGRAIGASCGCSVVSVERDPILADDAENLGRRYGVDVVGRVADVLVDPLGDLFGPGVAVVGLHACGALTDAALDHAVRHGASAILVPCCFHRVAAPYDSPRTSFPARSDVARRTGPTIDWWMLRLPGRVEEFARGKRRLLRRRAMAWRLSLDLLVRDASGRDDHTTGSRSERVALEATFTAWIEETARRDGLSLPPKWDPTSAEAAGWERLRVVRALGVVPSAFRRVVALFWVLDRAVSVVESGRDDVSVGAACDVALTPRNLGIRLAGG